MEEYGKNEKRISFMDTDKRNAELLIRLKHDGLTKTKFFRALLTGYLERDIQIYKLWFFKKIQTIYYVIIPNFAIGIRRN